MTPPSSTDPRIVALLNAVETRGLLFSIDVEDHLFRSVSYRILRVTADSRSFAIPVMDEYGDVPAAKPAVLLQLILTECVFLEEADDFTVWCQDVGLRASDELSGRLYSRLVAAVPQVRAIIGRDVQPIPHFEIEFNTSVAQALRGT